MAVPPVLRERLSTIAVPPDRMQALQDRLRGAERTSGLDTREWRLANCCELSSRFINLVPGEVDHEIEDGLRRMCEPPGIDLAVQMSALPHGALDAGQTTPEANAKNIRVVLQNSVAHEHAARQPPDVLLRLDRHPDFLLNTCN